jgi:hypothetical protein
MKRFQTQKYIILNQIIDLLFPCILVSGKPYGDDNNDVYANDDYEDADTTQEGGANGAEHVIHVLPKFVTTPQNVMVNEGATIKLPCLVNRLGQFRH